MPRLALASAEAIASARIATTSSASQQRYRLHIHHVEISRRRTELVPREVQPPVSPERRMELIGARVDDGPEVLWRRPRSVAVVTHIKIAVAVASRTQRCEHERASVG